MITVSAILNRKKMSPISVIPGTTVVQALQIMADKNIGCVVVMQDKTYLGIMTERDYSRKVVLNNKNSTHTPVEEIMSTDLPPIHLGDSIEHCMEIMTQNNIRYMPVFDQKELTGIISMSDVVKEIILSQKETITHLQSYIQQ